MMSSHIFRCSELEGYEMYCNIAVWDDSLLEQNENAQDVWLSAWEPVGPCAQ